MNDQSRYAQDAGQHPHTPGEDPRGSGQPRETPARQSGAEPDAVHSGAPEDNPQHNTAPDGLPGDQDDAPLGGDRTTQQQLEADTPVEEDALKSLDPDDTPD
jgi:hypothetical protein